MCCERRGRHRPHPPGLGERSTVRLGPNYIPERKRDASQCHTTGETHCHSGSGKVGQRMVAARES